MNDTTWFTMQVRGRMYPEKIYQVECRNTNADTADVFVDGRNVGSALFLSTCFALVAEHIDFCESVVLDA